MDIVERIKIVDNLQKISFEVFSAVINFLKAGMSEADIADLLTKEFEKRGITEFWYNGLQTVFVGAQRFKIGTTASDQAVIVPSKDIFLEEGSTVFIDLSPMDPETKLWGDWASMVVFQPRKGTSDEQVGFLQKMRGMQRSGLSQISSKTTGAEVANYYLNAFRESGITLLDVRNNVGHTIHEGPKARSNRIWLDENNTNPLGEGLFAVEPGGVRGNLVGRFEDCIYIPKEGTATLLGRKEVLPFVV